MNVFIVSNGIPKEEGKINGIFAFDQAKALSEIGYNVYFLVLDARSIRHKREWGFSKYKFKGIPVYEYSFPLGRSPFWLLQQVYRLCATHLFEEVKKDGLALDIVHSHFYDITYCVSDLRNKYRYKLIATEHYSGFVNPNIKNKDKLFIRATHAYKNVDSLITVSQSLADVICEKCNTNSTVIHNIIDVNVFSRCKSAHNDDEKIRYISVGRLTGQKNFPLLIDAFCKARKIQEKIVLDIYGDGELRESLNSKIIDNQATEFIKLHGAVDRKVISDALLESDCFILLSDYETFGVVYIEAIASGIPVIATNCGGPSDFVNSQNGCLIECGDEHEAVDAIIYMSDNYKNYHSTNISEEIKTRFSPHTIARQISVLY